jgi:malonyl CoA-acyl carrier protein transacylase
MVRNPQEIVADLIVEYLAEEEEPASEDDLFEMTAEYGHSVGVLTMQALLEGLVAAGRVILTDNGEYIASATARKPLTFHDVRGLREAIGYDLKQLDATSHEMWKYAHWKREKIAELLRSHARALEELATLVEGA